MRIIWFKKRKNSGGYSVWHRVMVNDSGEMAKASECGTQRLGPGEYQTSEEMPPVNRRVLRGGFCRLCYSAGKQASW